ncbi:hypothetical protein CAPTEDRAFT_122168 [Capitella teleta]|uniref:Rad50/SbcC-type AAA domain-containing protein n=1 Tax=Capitella teleta TaxID=283909 RepID=R7V5A4_CAPTE|nr:hypothetical protein CAPTEDRAFT_122168 [Capitella teleta]|eukprot:ELU13642.1 hypothetical protein CAPTEDRAFT_122168 [Capitella teleta]
MSACLEKLDISGIRSFSPELNQGSVELMTPVTLILGPNGTGKTTIIESLRYVTTGQFPPGSKGAGFVHDPKIAHETEVKAQVRLRFRNTQGLASCVTRSLIATQKPKGVTVRSLDGVFQMRALNGEKAAISSKCLQLDREMVAHLGVSRAILDNVIFCHQEDSNWPLGESKQLKQKFEDIFACTRYAKALDNINSICKKNVIIPVIYAMIELIYVEFSW